MFKTRGKNFWVRSDAGHRAEVIEYVISEGAPARSRSEYQLTDGTQLEPLYGDQQFADRNRGICWTREP